MVGGAAACNCGGGAATCNCGGGAAHAGWLVTWIQSRVSFSLSLFQLSSTSSLSNSPLT